LYDMDVVFARLVVLQPYVPSLATRALDFGWLV
jgi:hypothetical protein